MHMLESNNLINCRIGSLEKIRTVRSVVQYINCRIGSLETLPDWAC